MCASRVSRDVAQLSRPLLSTNAIEETVLCTGASSRVKPMFQHFLLVINIGLYTPTWRALHQYEYRNSETDWGIYELVFNITLCVTARFTLQYMKQYIGGNDYIYSQFTFVPKSNHHHRGLIGLFADRPASQQASAQLPAVIVKILTVSSSSWELWRYRNIPTIQATVIKIITRVFRRNMVAENSWK